MRYAAWVLSLAGMLVFGLFLLILARAGAKTASGKK